MAEPKEPEVKKEENKKSKLGDLLDMVRESMEEIATLKKQVADISVVKEEEKKEEKKEEEEEELTEEEIEELDKFFNEF